MFPWNSVAILTLVYSSFVFSLAAACGETETNNTEEDSSEVYGQPGPAASSTNGPIRQPSPGGTPIEALAAGVKNCFSSPLNPGCGESNVTKQQAAQNNQFQFIQQRENLYPKIYPTPVPRTAYGPYDPNASVEPGQSATSRAILHGT